MRIVFVRHGEPDYEHDCLTETGVKQAEMAAERLKEEGISEIWASPLGRAQQTAKIASEVLGLPVKTVDCMREITWGSIDGSPLFADGHPWDTVDKMAADGVDLNMRDWRTSPYFVNNHVVQVADGVERGIDEWLAGLGYVRRGAYYEHTLAEDEHKTIAMFSHGGSSSVAIGHMMNLPFPYMCAMMHMEFTSITILRMGRKKGLCPLPCLELSNDSRHIKEGKYHRLQEM